MDFDGRFQVRVGTVFRAFLPSKSGNCVNRLTIARLVMLVYLVARLAEDKKGTVTIVATGRKLDVKNIEQNLERGEIQ
jgi:hypothetical protein